MPATMPRRRTIAIVAGVLLVVLAVAVVVGLPPLVRKLAVDQIAKTTGRATSLDRVEINLFTGRVALYGFRLAQKSSNDPALELEGVEVRLAITSLLGSHLRIPNLVLTTPRLHVARLSETEFDFSDLLALIPPPDPTAKPSTRTITVERITLANGAVYARDDVTKTKWAIDGLTVDGVGLGTRPGPPGRLNVGLKLNGTPISVVSEAIDVAKGMVAATLRVDGFDITQVQPFVPPTLGAMPTAGKVTVALDLKAENVKPMPRVLVAGDVQLDGLAVQLADATTPFVSIGALAVTLGESEPLARRIAVKSVALDGVDAKVARLEDGSIDVLALVARKPAGAAAGTTQAAVAPPAVAAPAVAAAPPPPLNVTVQEVHLRNAKVTLRDDVVKTTLALADLNVAARDIALPGGSPLAFDVSTGLPGAGKLLVKGTATLEPIVAEFTMSMRGAPITPYQPYIPIPGRFAGTFNGESKSKVSIVDGKLAVAASEGKSWIENLELRVPGAPAGAEPPVRVARIAIDGVDFRHPGRAAAKSIVVTKPSLRVERDANGDINIRKLFAADTPPIETTRERPQSATTSTAGLTTPAAETPARPEDAAKPAGDMVLVFTSPIPVELGSFVIDDGYARFMDRSVEPAFAETLSKLSVRLTGLSSEPGRRADLAVQAIVGGDSALDLKGKVAPFGELYADIAGELRRFALPSVNPYADNAIAWVIEKGALTVKLHYTIEKNQLTANNEIIVDNLHVAQSKKEDEVQKRIGLPLGLIVALITDSNNGIRVNLPLQGSLQTWSVDLSDAIWTAVKNVVVNVVAAPFRAIGRMFKGKGDTIESVAIDPAPFAVGSPTLAPEGEGQIQKVADFMRKSPAIRLTLAPVTTKTDAESLREQALTARIQKVQRDLKLDTFDKAVDAEYTRVFGGDEPPKSAEGAAPKPPAGTPPPKTGDSAAPPKAPEGAAPPMKTEEKLAKLREREPVPTELVAELAKRRLTVVRETLSEKEGIPAVRLGSGDAASGDGGGRVEFTIGQ
jgi:uncharacterized protein involved in outer membrane biogenesis